MNHVEVGAEDVREEGQGLRTNPHSDAEASRDVPAVAGTMYLARQAGLDVFATGGIGGKLAISGDSIGFGSQPASPFL